MKTIEFSRPPGSACSGITTPFGITSYSPGRYLLAEVAASSETAIR
jgi:hypothetical protein